MIYDCFTFFNELDLLEIRLEELKDVVDRFVLVEATKTFSNLPKSLVYAENKERFKAFQDRIIHIVVEDLPETPKDSWENQHIQRNAISRGLADCAPDDIIIISDVDEIPRASAIAGFEGEIAFLEQNLYYYRLNCLCTSAKWAIPVVFRYRNLTTPQELRMYWYDKTRRETIPTIADAGWHFSYLGDVDSIQLKLNSFSQQDFNTPEVNNKSVIEEKIEKGIDLFGRQQYQWAYVKIDSSYPHIIYDNKFRYANYIKGKDLESTVFFDQYSRYKACSDILEAVCDEGSTILDVGSGMECVLGDFLPHRNITFLDPLITNLPERPSNKLPGDAFSKRVDGQVFDWVVSIDTLEHVPPAFRRQFLERLASLANTGLILAFPASDAGDAAETDAWINKVYNCAFGKDYCWLEEHLANGLPSLQETVSLLEAYGWKTQITQNGHTPWMRELLSFTLCGLEVDDFKRTVQELSSFFNRHLYPFDHLKPGYRQIVIATKNQLHDLPMPHHESADTAQEAVFHWEQLELKIAASPYPKLVETTKSVKEKELQLKTSERELATRGQQLTERDRQLSEKTRKLVEAERLISDQKLLLDRLEGDLAERKQHAANLDQHLASQDRHISRLDQDLAERNRQISNLNRQISNLNRDLADRDGHIAKYREAQADRDQLIANLYRNVAEKDQRIQTLAERSASAERDLTESNQRIQALLTSKSWKVTAPLRKACDLVGKK